MTREGIPIGPIVLPFWGFPHRILIMNPKKGTTLGPMGKDYLVFRI